MHALHFYQFLGVFFPPKLSFSPRALNLLFFILLKQRLKVNKSESIIFKHSILKLRILHHFTKQILVEILNLRTKIDRNDDVHCYQKSTFSRIKNKLGIIVQDWVFADIIEIWIQNWILLSLRTVTMFFLNSIQVGSNEDYFLLQRVVYCTGITNPLKSQQTLFSVTWFVSFCKGHSIRAYLDTI